MGQGRLLAHTVRQQILGARESRAQWVLCTVAGTQNESTRLATAFR
ncbi:MAG: hypothetical protein ACLPXZ_17435 [Mycobacterium sp.]